MRMPESRKWFERFNLGVRVQLLMIRKRFCYRSSYKARGIDTMDDGVCTDRREAGLMSSNQLRLRPGRVRRAVGWPL